MAITRKYIQPANTNAKHAAIFGTLAAGGGLGTDVSPWANWNNMEALVESTGQATNDLEVYVHPAASFASPGSQFLLWDNVGRGTGWASVKIMRWDDKVADDIRYEDWYPTIDSHVYVASGSWTRGTISGNTFVAGAGTIYRMLVPSVPYVHPATVRCWGGTTFGDTRATHTVPCVWCYTLADVDLPGDFATAMNGADMYVYVNSGSATNNPTVEWGGFSYHKVSGNGTVTIYQRDSRGVTWKDFQCIGGMLRFMPPSGGHTNDLTLDHIRHRMCVGNGVTFTSYAGTDIKNTRILEPDFDSGCHPTREDRGAFSHELQSQNGINSLGGNVDGFLVRNPKIRGYSHGNFFIGSNPGVAGGASDDLYKTDITQYPRNVEIECTDYSDGKCVLTGGPGYQRAFAFLMPINCVVGPLRVTQQTVQSQIGGDVTLRGVQFDDTCGPWSDPWGSGNFNAGAHLFNQTGSYTSVFPVQKLRLMGCVHDNEGEYAMYWQNTSGHPTRGEILFHGGLVRDDGHVRYRPQSGNSTTAACTRLKTPYLGDDEGSQIPFAQQIRDTMFVLDPACDGIAALKNVSSSTINATTSTHPPIQYNSTGAWGGGLISGNSQSTSLATFDYAKIGGKLVFTGRRRTPYRNGGSSTGRGY